jgi:hypothetical protein
MNGQSFNRRLNIINLNNGAVSHSDLSAIGELTTALGIEGCSIEY